MTFLAISDFLGPQILRMFNRFDASYPFHPQKGPKLPKRQNGLDNAIWHGYPDTIVANRSKRDIQVNCFSNSKLGKITLKTADDYYDGESEIIEFEEESHKIENGIRTTTFIIGKPLNATLYCSNEQEVYSLYPLNIGVSENSKTSKWGDWSAWDPCSEVKNKLLSL